MIGENVAVATKVAVIQNQTTLVRESGIPFIFPRCMTASVGLKPPRLLCLQSVISNYFYVSNYMATFDSENLHLYSISNYLSNCSDDKMNQTM